jgi:type II secretory pathway component PulF
LILLAFFTVWLWFIALWLVPVMATLQADFRTELPAVTRYLIELARLTPGVILAVAVASLLIAAAGRTTSGAAFVSRLWSKLPWIGPAWWYRGLVEFCGLTAVFLEQGMPLPEALRLTSLASRDAAIRRACGRMADEVASGQALSTCLARRSLFPPTLASTVAWGENHAALPEACQSARQMFCERLESQTELIRLVLPSMIFLLLGASVLFVAIGFFSGLLKLMVDLTG